MSSRFHVVRGVATPPLPGDPALRGRGLRSEVIDRLLLLADDPAPDVRAVLASTSGKLPADDRRRPEVRRTLERLASGGDPAVRERAEESPDRPT